MLVEKRLIYVMGILYAVVFLLIATILVGNIFQIKIISQNINSTTVQLLFILILLIALPFILPRITEITFGNTKLSFEKMEKEIKNCQELVENIVAYNLGEHIFNKLLIIAGEKEEKLYFDPEDKALCHQLQMLQDLGFLHLNPLLSNLKVNEDLSEIMHVTDVGKSYIKYRNSKAK